MSLKSFYHKMEDNYFNFLDRMEKKGVNLYKIVDPLEKRGIPTFALFCLIIIAVLVLLGFLIAGQFTSVSANDDVVLNFLDATDNPIVNESFDLNISGNIKSIRTDSTGIARLKGIETGFYYLELIDNKYIIATPNNMEVTTVNKTFNIYLEEQLNSYSKTISFIEKSSEQLITSPIVVKSITCSDNTEFIKENITVDDGTYTLNGIPIDCGELIVDLENQTLESTNLNNKNETGIVYLEASEDRKGDITISVLDDELNIPVTGVIVKLLTQDGVLAGQETTGTSGMVQFTNIKVGEYYLSISDPSAVYSGISPYEGIKVNVIEGISSEQVKIKKDIIGTIKLRVIDNDTSLAIANVSVSLFKGVDKLSELKTDANGLVNFGIREDIAYTINFDHADYTVSSQKSLRKNEAVQTIRLKRINQDNFRGVIVAVVDKTNQPIEYANIRLWDLETNTIVKTAITDVFGKIIIPNLDPQKTYKIDAVFGKYVSSPSSPFMIVERQLTEVTVVMEIGEVTYNISLTDGSGPVSTEVSVYDVYNNLEIQNKKTTTGTDGTTIIRVRADKTVYFVINNFESKFITGKYSAEANNTVKLNFVIPKVSSSSNIELLGFYDASGNLVTSVSPGQSVKARFILNVNKDYSKAVAHIRVGSGNKCDNLAHVMEADDIYIKDISAATDKISGSVSYTPCNGEAQDLSSKTARDAKWFNVSFDKPMFGSYLVEATLVVSDQATSALPLYYRSEFYTGGSILRYPQDEVLGNDYTSSTKQALYAYSKEAQVFTGQSNFCDSSVCYNFYIYNESSKTTKNVIDKYSTKSSTAHKLYFNLNFLRPVPGAQLNVTGNGSTILLKDYSIESVGSKVLTGKEFDAIDLGSIGANDFVSGVISFAITNDSSDMLNFSILSSADVIFSKSILMDIKPSKAMNLEIIPRSFTPFVPNESLIVISDDDNKTIDKADVTVKLNKQLIYSGQTNNKGEYGFVVPAPDLADSVEIIVKKEGYSTIDTTLIVSSNLVTTIPDKVDVYLNLSQEYSSTTNIALINNTTLPLTIKSVKYNANNQFVKLQLIGDEQILIGGASIEYALKVTVTEEGINLMVAKTFVTDIVVTFENPETSKEWEVKIPVNVRIGFGNSLDTLDCLQITPLTLELRGDGNSTIESSFKIKNNCTVNSENVNLNNLVAELDWSTTKEIGSFSLVAKNKTQILEPLVETPILSTIAGGKEEVIKIIFKVGKISSASSEPKIILRSKVPNLNGVDIVESELDLSVIINNYSKCIDVPTTPVTVLACPYGSGSSQFNNYYGYGTGTNSWNTTGSYNTGLNNTSSYNTGTGNAFSNGYNPNRYYNAGNTYNYSPYSVNQSYNQASQAGTYNYGSSTGYVGSNMSSMYNYNNQNLLNNTGINANAYQTYNMLDSGYGYGAGISGNMMGCQSRPIYITNNCSESIDLQLENSYGVNLVSGNEVTLEKGEKTQVLVTGAEEMGTFSLGVSARASTETEGDYKLVKEIPIQVTLPLSYLPSKCIVVTPQKLNFSGLKSGYQNVDIYNMCYDQGYRLIEVNYQDLNELKFQDIYFLTITEARARIEPIRVDQVTDSKTNKPIERWTITLRRNPEVERIVVQDYVDKYGTDAAGVVSAIRTAGFDIGEQVALKFMLSVGIQQPNLTQQPIYTNVGMELIDNMQWAGLLNNSNAGLFGLNNPATPEQKQKWLLMYVNQEDKDAISYVPTFLYDNDLIFIKVKPEALTADKFKRLDNDNYASVCFIGLIKDFPIAGISETSFIPFDQNQSFQNNGKRLNVQISFLEEGYYKLCFKRPLDELTADEVKVYDKFPNLFDLDAYTLDGKKVFLQRRIYIGVDANVGRDKIEGGSPIVDANIPRDLNTTNPDGTPTGVTLSTCSDPQGKPTTDAFTGNVAFEKYGFNRVLLDWVNVDYKTCDMGNYYCDQEQLYKSISEKQKKINNGQYVELCDYKFAKADDGSPEKLTQIWSKQNFKLDTTVEAALLAGDTNLAKYIEVSMNVLNKVPYELQETTIVEVSENSAEITDTNFENFVKVIVNDSSSCDVYSNNNIHYFTVNAYVYGNLMGLSDTDILTPMKAKFNCTDLTQNMVCKNGVIDDNLFNAYLQEFYVNMELFYGVGLNVFVANITKYADLASSDNVAIMKTRGLFNDYEMELNTSSGLKNINVPGAYYISVESANKIITMDFFSKVEELDEFTDTTDRMYSKNPIFYNPINPNYNAYNTKGAPFLAGGYTSIDYYSLWNKMQEGYIFRYSQTSTKTTPPIFISSVPVVVSIGSVTPTVQLIRNNNVTSFTKTWTNPTLLYVLNEDKTGTSAYQLQLKSSTALTFNKFVTSTVDKQYEIAKNISSTSGVNYTTIKELIDAIKTEKVCFNTTQSELKTWNAIK